MIKVVTYVSSDADCPPGARAVAHCYEWGRLNGGPKRGQMAWQLLPATQTGESEEVCRAKLEAFLAAEIAKEQGRERRAAEHGDRMRAVHAARKAGAA